MRRNPSSSNTMCNFRHLVLLNMKSPAECLNFFIAFSVTCTCDSHFVPAGTHANSLHYGLKIIWKQLVDFASTFAEVLIWDCKNCFHPVSSLAVIVLGLVKQVSIQKLSSVSIHCNAKVKQCHCPTRVFMNVFDVHLTPKSLLEGRCPRNPGAATAITTPRH